MVQPETKTLVEVLQKTAPKTSIIWFSASPLPADTSSFFGNLIPADIKNVFDKRSAVNGLIRSALAITGGCYYESPFDYIDTTNKNFFTPDGKNLSEAGFKELINRAKTGTKFITASGIPNVVDAAKNVFDKITGASDEDLKDLNKFIDFGGDKPGLKKELLKELIKLSKAAKVVFDDPEAKISSQSTIRDGTINHGDGSAIDFRIYANGQRKSAQITYAFIIDAIVAGVIKDGGVGYYANNKGTYDPNKMDTGSEFPHYDLNDVRKWFWFKCEPDIAACKRRVDSSSFKDNVQGDKKIQQTSGGQSASDVANTSNPLSLPKDVFNLIGTFSQKMKSDNPVSAAINSAIGGISRSMNVSLDNNQKENLEKIKKKFQEANFPENLTKAAIVNSWYESNWRNNVAGDEIDNKCAREIFGDKAGKKGSSCGGGLFGIHSCGGRGGCRAPGKIGMTLEQIIDPEQSINLIIKDIKTDRQTGAILEKSNKPDATVEDLVYHFCWYVENPGNKDYKCNYRKTKTQEILSNAGYV